ncbi:uncharacterized protein TNCV_3870731 [Trichonephila clavipes]|nr:uncharacterized protein TNCV_3870731 [Trichonephila clavipes]
MPLIRRRSHYQQLTEVIGLREDGFFFPRDILQQDLAGMYLLCMIIGSSGEGMVLPQEDRVPGRHEALLRGKPPILADGCDASYCVCDRNFELQLVPQ